MRLFVLFVILLQSFLVGATARKNSITQGDAAFAARKDPDRARQALGIYRELAKAQGSSSEILWRLSMACQYLGMRVETEEDAQRELFSEGSDVAKQAIAVNPDCVPCHFWYAVNRALYAQNVGIFKMIFSIGEIQQHLEEAASRDPSYALGGPYRVLGVIQQRLPGILGGSHDRARALFEKAVAAAPQEPMNYEILAKHIYEHDNNPSLALDVARRGIKLSRAEVGVPESEQAAEALQSFAESVVEK